MFKPNPVAAALSMGVFLLASCGGRPDDGTGPEEHDASSMQAPGPAAPAPAPTFQVTAAAMPAESLSQLRQDVTQLQREVAALRQQMMRAPGAAVSAEAAGSDPRTDPSARQEAERSERQRLATSEAAFRAEQRDARWSQDTTANVRTALATGDDAMGAQVRSIECHSRSCRVEIGPDAGVSLVRDLPAIINRLGQTLPNVTAGTVDQGDGRQSTVLYLSR